MATIKAAIGSVFGVVTDVSTMVGGVAQSGSAGVGMLNKYIADASVKQNVASAVDMHLYRNRLKREVAQSEAESNVSCQEFRSRSSAHAELFDEALKDISAIIDAA